ncbi:MAG: hypothetical protein KF800_19125 [Lysobacter sp.]|nr:hypothetical protein [Lysobacter sp.]
MARIRTIKPEFWSSEQVMELSFPARIAFIGLWSFCDDRGVHTASAKRLKAEVFPSDEITTDVVSGLVAEMIHHGLVGEFEADGERYWYVTGWNKHQKIEKPTYRHPSPPSAVMPRRCLAEDSANGRRKVDDHSLSNSQDGGERSTPEGNGMEGKGEESKDQEQSSLRSDSSTATPLTAGQSDAGDGTKPNSAEKAAARAARLSQVTRDAIETFNASKLTKANGGLVPNVDPDVGADKRRAQVAKCLKVARDICKKDYDSEIVVREFWIDYWDECLNDEHKSGRTGGGKDHGNWLPSFEYLTREATMLEVYERAVSRIAVEAAQ